MRFNLNNNYQKQSQKKRGKRKPYTILGISFLLSLNKVKRMNKQAIIKRRLLEYSNT
jgi:type II secretory pathway component PulK